MPITTNVSGVLYKPDGTLIEEGKLFINLAQDFTAIDGTKVAPFTSEIVISTGGSTFFSVFATSNSVNGSAYSSPVPTGLTYTIEFDPDPNNTSLAISRKNGYWKNVVDIPHVSDTPANNNITISSLTPATTSSPSYGDPYVPINDPRVNLVSQLLLGAITLTDGVTAPSATSGKAIIYVDTSGGDLKIIFGDGTVKTIVTD